MTCDELEELAAELALGTVSGADRAGALDHLARCAACRDLVDSLARVADTVLLLAPPAEPPPGFESRVLTRMRVAPGAIPVNRPRRRYRVLVGLAAAALVGGLAGAGVSRTGGDVEVRPAGVRTVLVNDAQGRWTCRASVYGAAPTWLVVSLDRTDGLNATFSVEAVRTGDPAPVPVGTFTLEQGHGTFARPVELAADDLLSVRVLDATGRVRYTMSFPGTT